MLLHSRSKGHTPAFLCEFELLYLEAVVEVFGRYSRELTAAKAHSFHFMAVERVSGAVKAPSCNLLFTMTQQMWTKISDGEGQQPCGLKVHRRP